LAELRRTLPALTDPDLRRVSVEFDEGERWLVLRRGAGMDAVTVAVNFSDRQMRVPLGDDDAASVVAFATPGAARPVSSPVEGDHLLLPAHVGLLLKPMV
ncbi:MAG: DUF3459 domain-containing protein, partial [Nocardioides sp.]